nr:DUF1289 domain-containing protein [Psychrosphaera aestuarii]
MDQKKVPSPCVRNCCLNEQDVCIGCFRDISEIMAWSSMSNSEKEETLKHCKQRELKEN